MFYTEELYIGRAGSPPFNINLRQKTVVAQTPEKLYPQRMTNSSSPDASYQAASNQVTLEVRPPGLLYSKAPSMLHKPHFRHLVDLPGKGYHAVRIGHYCSRMQWGVNNI